MHLKWFACTSTFTIATYCAKMQHRLHVHIASPVSIDRFKWRRSDPRNHSVTPSSVSSSLKGPRVDYQIVLEKKYLGLWTTTSTTSTTTTFYALEVPTTPTFYIILQVVTSRIPTIKDNVRRLSLLSLLLCHAQWLFGLLGRSILFMMLVPLRRRKQSGRSRLIWSSISHPWFPQEKCNGSGV